MTTQAVSSNRLYLKRDSMHDQRVFYIKDRTMENFVVALDTRQGNIRLNRCRLYRVSVDRRTANCLIREINEPTTE